MEDVGGGDKTPQITAGHFPARVWELQRMGLGCQKSVGGLDYLWLMTAAVTSITVLLRKRVSMLLPMP